MPGERVDWQVLLVNYLIGGGTVGRSQTEVTFKLKNHVKVPEFMNYLEVLVAQEKVQKFRLPSRGNKVTYWRATTKILDDV